jgi:hypothetical protein
VGCPIRKSSDQRVFAPPRRLSQRITSFIACACQGIHQLPLRHLIILIANAHPGQNPRRYWRKKTSFSRSERWPRSGWPIRCRGLSVPLRQTIPQKEDGVRSNLLFTMSKQTGGTRDKARPQTFPMRMTAGPKHPSRPKDRLKNTGGAGRDRTDDPLLAKQVLSQLSYGPVAPKARRCQTTDIRGQTFCHPFSVIRPLNLVGLGGLEPPTSRLSSARSNQLSYKPWLERTRHRRRGGASQGRPAVAARAAPRGAPPEGRIKRERKPTRRSLARPTGEPALGPDPRVAARAAPPRSASIPTGCDAARERNPKSFAKKEKRGRHVPRLYARLGAECSGPFVLKTKVKPCRRKTLLSSVLCHLTSDP